MLAASSFYSEEVSCGQLPQIAYPFLSSYTFGLSPIFLLLMSKAAYELGYKSFCGQMFIIYLGLKASKCYCWVQRVSVCLQFKGFKLAGNT